MSHGSQWLVIAGAVSGYSWDLFRQISRRSGGQVRVFHRPPDADRIRRNFAHESFTGEGSVSFDSSRMSPGELRRTMDVGRADAILIFGTISRLAVAQALLGRRAACPVIFAADTNVDRIFPTRARDWARLMAYRALAHWVTEAWTLGQSNEQAFRLLGFKKLRPLPFYSVTFEELGPPRQAEKDRTGAPVPLLAIGRLAPEKNFEALVRAVAQPELRSRATLTIVGDGPARGSLEALTNGLQATNVRLAGTVPHSRLGQYFQQACGLVIPSCLEPWGNVVTEALGMGIPVLATPAVGAATSVAGRYLGVQITRTHNADGLAEGLLRFLDDMPLLEQAALAQTARVRSEFDVNSVAERMIEAIAELHGKNSDQKRASRTAPPAADGASKGNVGSASPQKAKPTELFHTAFARQP